MRYQRLDLNLLTALRALLTERNVTRAGEQLHVSQSAMSGMLARLREYFDDALIVPVGRRMELTPLAETLVDKVNDLMLRLDATLATRPDFDPATSRRQFSIVASDYVAQVLLLDVLRELHHEAPGLRLEFRHPSNAAAVDLENGEVDFVINPQRFTTPNQASTVLFEDSYHAVVDRANTAVGDVLSLDSYRQQRHVTLEVNGRPQFETWFISEHGAPAHTEVVVNAFSLLPPLVLGTSRVATLHTRMALQAARQWPVRLVALGFEAPRLVETLQWHRYRDLDPASQYLRDKIIRHARALPAVEALMG
ncbi:LysR family transcriptional regulator [Aquabacterium sp. OR-4]|uniref:LysR family transcriptional regulator n=1 Tax=Aquabacterium sp. OR-4 TaxID=2978127 RepID=UPI0021B1B14C|nr:LysR family transcriptional regulator [Aquabacterium sp. OR-4]MDT7836996.1 LysR family transcriptional regulator [Aquabacterium sp. OR-4]